MKIHKEFVNLLKQKREAWVRDLLGEDGLKIIVCNSNKCEKNLNSLDDLDRIFYTLEFLERENLVTVTLQDYHVIYQAEDCLKCQLEKSEIDHLFFTQDLFEKHYRKKIKIETSFFDFIDSGYKTDLQRERKINFWLVISIAIGTAVLASFLTAYFTHIFS